MYQGSEGAPMFSCRLDPVTYEQIKSHPEGPRPYLQRLVREDIERTKPAELESTNSNDVPGQLLLSDSET